MSYEEIGKEAVKHGYDGGGIWVKPNDEVYWRCDYKAAKPIAGSWPHFHRPETEGAALAWILEKYNEKHKTNYEVCYIDFRINRLALRLEKKDCVCVLIEGPDTKPEAILAAIKSLNLCKKDNSSMALNKRLLGVGFRRGGCAWIDTGNGRREILDIGSDVSTLNIYHCWTPEGSHPSTIGVATAWLRSFSKIGETLHFWKGEHITKWRASWCNISDHYAENLFDSELEALVEFAEWAKEEGLLR